MDLFLLGKSFPTGFSMQVAPPLIIPPRLTARPKAVPIITAKITAGIFFISPMELTPIPIAQTPKILVSSVLNFTGSLCPNNAPITPPAATDRALMITPIGIFIPLLSIISGNTNFVLKHSHNRKEQILFPLFHTENNFLSFFITEIVKSIILLISCSHYTT